MGRRLDWANDARVHADSRHGLSGMKTGRKKKKKKKKKKKERKREEEKKKKNREKL